MAVVDKRFIASRSERLATSDAHLGRGDGVEERPQERPEGSHQVRGAHDEQALEAVRVVCRGHLGEGLGEERAAVHVESSEALSAAPPSLSASLSLCLPLSASVSASLSRLEECDVAPVEVVPPDPARVNHRHKLGDAPPAPPAGGAEEVAYALLGAHLQRTPPREAEASPSGAAPPSSPAAAQTLRRSSPPAPPAQPAGLGLAARGSRVALRGRGRRSPEAGGRGWESCLSGVGRVSEASRRGH